MTRAQLGSKQGGLELPKDLTHLPSTVADLVPLYRACIVRFDAAVHARDFDAAAAAASDAHDVVIERAKSLPRFTAGRRRSGLRYNFYDVAQIFERLTRAAPGAVPLFGQTGEFVTMCSLTRVRFKTQGLAGIGVSAYGGRVLGFDIRAVEWDRGFYTETGYRSFLCSSLEVGERTDDVRQWCMGHLRHWWNGEGGRPTKFALRRIRSAAPAPAALVVDSEDDDDAPTCPDCGDFTEGGGLCAGCRSNKAVRTSKQLTLF